MKEGGGKEPGEVLDGGRQGCGSTDQFQCSQAVLALAFVALKLNPFGNLLLKELPQLP